jgi:hypothetical protein
MTAIRKTTLQVAYFQGFTNLTTDLCTSNDRFGIKSRIIKDDIRFNKNQLIAYRKNKHKHQCKLIVFIDVINNVSY